MRFFAVVLLLASVLYLSTTTHSEEPEASVPAYMFDYGLFTKPYKSNEHGAFFLPSGMKWKVMPQYVGRSDDGKTSVDDRITLVLQDAKKGFWPFIAKMDIEEADALQKSLAAIIAEKKGAKASSK
ncbi:hypothetical protein [Crateriforma spongiae]|uniref:hypothetical protein n=1 Tax=Crateriforma spongiae TaxID=2724528 RepID=UPI0039AF4382